MLNQFMGSDPETKPEVGMGATILMWTDRLPATVVEVVSPKKIVIQHDDAKRIDNNGMSEAQDYEFTPNLDAAKETYTQRKDGQWVREGSPMKGGTRIILGARRKYYDFSF